MDAKYRIDTTENRTFLETICEDLLRFGHGFPSPAGSSYYLGDDGTPWKERPRETWVTCRMAHVYSIGQMLGHAGSGELADAAIKGLLGELKDEKNGGWYPGVTAEQEILPDKQCYAHAFVILAGTSALLAGRPDAETLLQEALSCYDEHFWDEGEGLAYDTWDTAFTKLDPYRGLNANMHTVEAFLAAADVLGDKKYRDRAGRIIRRVLEWASANDWRIPEHFSSDWQPQLELNKERPADPFKPYGATPGHGIEWARLITQWAASVYGAGAEEPQRGRTEPEGSQGNRTEPENSQGGVGSSVLQGKDAAASEALKRYVEAAECLYQRAVGDAWNADGAPGIVYTTDWNGEPVVHDRMHWTLAEAINTSAVLYRVTGKAKYADDYSEYMKYLDEKVLDHVNGSWFHQLDRENRLIGTVWPGKSDIYHALQATLIPYSRPDLSIAAAVREKTGRTQEQASRAGCLNLSKVQLFF